MIQESILTSIEELAQKFQLAPLQPQVVQLSSDASTAADEWLRLSEKLGLPSVQHQAPEQHASLSHKIGGLYDFQGNTAAANPDTSAGLFLELLLNQTSSTSTILGNSMGSVDFTTSSGAMPTSFLFGTDALGGHTTAIDSDAAADFFSPTDEIIHTHSDHTCSSSDECPLTPPDHFQILPKINTNNKTAAVPATKKRYGNKKRPIPVSENDDGTPVMGTGKRPKYQRTKTGCLCCRKKRVKCDETRPGCKRCVAAGRECLWPEVSTASSVSGDEHKIPVVASYKKAVSTKKNNKVNEIYGSRKSSISVRSVSPVVEQPLYTTLNVSSSNSPVSPPLQLYAGSASGGSDGGDETSPFNGSIESFDDMFNMESGSPVFNFDVDLASFDSFPSSIMNEFVAPSATKAEEMTLISPMAIDQPAKVASPVAAAPMIGAGMNGFLVPWFPTKEERDLIVHFSSISSSLLQSIPSAAPPLLTLLLPLSLSSPRGFSVSTDALRLTLLATSAAHQSYLLGMSGAPTEVLSNSLESAISFRGEARSGVKNAVEEGVKSEKPNVLEILAGGTMLVTVDMLLGGHNYLQGLNLMKAFVASQGGVDVFIATHEDKSQPVSTIRLLLDVLATYDVFGSLLSSSNDALLVTEGSWWSASSSENDDALRHHFGIDRSTVTQLAQVSSLLTRAKNASGEVSEHDGLFEDLLFGEMNNESDVVEIKRDCEAFLKGVDEELKNTSSIERVAFGNTAYLNSAKIAVLRNVFKVARSDVRVQQASLNVLESCSAAVAAGLPVNLSWPMVMSSTQIDAPARPWASAIIQGFRAKCCFNVDSCDKIIREVWARLDSGDSFANWDAAVQNLDLKVLIT